jgi:tetratricopeptide (TPR) repeat protein
LPLLAIPLDVEVAPTTESAAIDPTLVRSRVNAAVKDLLVAAAGNRPAVWVIDDAHWLDEASRSTLVTLALDIEERPWSLVLARWPGPDALPGIEVRSVALAALDARESIELARSAAGGVLLPQDAQLVAERAAGSPLFVQELARSVCEHAGEDDLELPETVQALIATRLDALPPRDRELLQTAAVLGRRSRRGLLERMVDAGDRRRLAQLDAFLVLDGESVAFRHGLVRDVAYERLPFRQRRALHLRAATVAEAELADREDAAELLSLHFHHANDAARSWRYSTLAARRAEQKNAYIEATTYWTRAIDAGRRVGSSPSELGEAWLSLGDAYNRSARLDEASRSYGWARRLLADVAKQGRLCLLEGLVRQARGEGALAIRWYRRGLKVIGDAPGPEAHGQRIRLRLACADVEYRRGRYADALREAEQAFADAQASGDDGGIGHSCNMLLLAGTAMGDPASDAHGWRAHEAFGRAGHLIKQGEVLNNLGQLAQRNGRWVEATELLTRARKALGEGGDVLATAVVSHNLAELLSDQGHLDEARELMEEALTTFRGARSQFVPYTQTLLGRLASRMGDHPAAEELLQSAEQGVRRLGDTDEVAKAIAYQAERLLFAGRHREAASKADELLADAPALIRPLVHRVKGCALATIGDTAEARVSLLEGLRLAHATKDDLETALLSGALAWVAGEAGQPAEASSYAAEADRVLRRLGVVRPHSGVPTPVPG